MNKQPLSESRSKAEIRAWNKLVSLAGGELGATMWSLQLEENKGFLINLFWCFLSLFYFFSEITSQSPSLWMERERSRQNRTRASRESSESDVGRASGPLCAGLARVSDPSRSRSVPVSFKGQRKAISLGAEAQQAWRICLAVVFCNKSVIILTWHKHRISHSSLFFFFTYVHLYIPALLLAGRKKKESCVSFREAERWEPSVHVWVWVWIPLS